MGTTRTMPMVRRFRLVPLLALLLILPSLRVGPTQWSADAQQATAYLPNAEIGWRKTLLGRMRRGNGMAMTREGVIIATTDNGMLHQIRNNGSTSPDVTVYSPASVVPDGVALLCRSKPVLAGGMAIYAVSGTLVAVNATDLTTTYATQLPYPIVGTPAVSRRGQSIYVTHNDPVTNVGSISVLRLTTGQLLATLSTGTNVPLGPPAVVHRTDPVVDDIVVFGDSTDAGYSTSTAANVFALLWDMDEHTSRAGEGEGSYRLIVAASNGRAMVTAPEFTNDLRVYLGGRGSTVTAYDRNTQINLFDGDDQTVGVPAWTAALDVDPSNPLAPIPATPVASADNLFVAAAGNHIASIALSGRNNGWDDRSIASPVYSQPIYYDMRGESSAVILSPVLYFVTRDGILYQKDAWTGITYWTFDLEFPVDADMAISENGNLLYVGDTDGNLHAVRVVSQPTTAPTSAPIGGPTGSPVAAAMVPTNGPTTMAPIGAPVAVVPPVLRAPTGSPETRPTNQAPATTTNPAVAASPVVAPTQATVVPPPPTGALSNAQDENNAKEMPSNFILYLAAMGALLVLICCLACVLRRRCRKRRRHRLEMKKSVESTANTTLADTDRVGDEEKQQQEAYERECAENERLTLMELAESPIKMNNHRSNRSIASWDTTSTGKTPTHHALTSIEEAPEAEDDRKSGDDNKSLDDEVAMAEDESSILDVMSGAEDEPDNRRGEQPIKGIAATLAESTDALAKAVGAAVAAISTWDEGKGSDGLKSRVGSALQLRRVKSTGSDLSTPTQPGRIRSSDRNRAASPSDMMSVDSSSIYLDEPSIHSIDRVLKNSAVEDAVMGKAEPAPKDCPEDEGRGVLRPGSAYLSRYNEKKAMDLPPEFDGVVRSRSAPRIGNDAAADRLQPVYNGVSVRPAGRSGAGIFSRRQPHLNNYTDDEEEDEPAPETKRKLPVKLGPKRSDILRSQRPLSDDEAEEGIGQPPQFTAHGYYEEPEDIANIVSVDSEDLPAPAPVPAERVRRSSKSKRRTSSEPKSPNASLTMADPWGSFLSELSKVETSFFSTSGLLAGRNTAEKDDATAEESNASVMSPPPAPRTFYA